MVSSGIRIGAWDYLQWKHVSPITNDKGEIVAARLVGICRRCLKNTTALSHLKHTILLKTGWIFEHHMAKIFLENHGLCAISGKTPTLRMVLIWDSLHVQ